MAGEPNLAAGRGGTATLSPGQQTSASASTSAAASRIRVDISDVTKLKGALKDVTSQTDKLVASINKLDSGIALIKKMNTALAAMQTILAGSGSGSSGYNPPSSAQGSSGSYMPSGSFSSTASQSSSSSTVTPSYTPSTALPSVNLLPSMASTSPAAPRSTAPSGGGSYNQPGTFSGQPPTSNNNTPSYPGQSYITEAAGAIGGMASISGLVSGHLANAAPRSYLLNQFAMANGSGSTSLATQQQYNMGLSGSSMFGGLGLNYGDYSAALGTLMSTGVYSGSMGQARAQSAGFLQAINPTQGLGTTMGLMSSATTPSAYYGLRMAGINPQFNKTGGLSQSTFRQIYQRLGLGGRGISRSDIESGNMQGTHMNLDLQNMGITGQLAQDFVTYAMQTKYGGGVGSAASTNNLQQSVAQRSGAQATAGSAADAGYIPGAIKTQQDLTAVYNKLSDVLQTKFGKGLTYAAGRLSGVDTELGHLESLLKGVNALLAAMVGSKILGGAKKLLTGGSEGGGLLGEAGVAGVATTAGMTAGIGGGVVAAGLLINQGITDKNVAQAAERGAGLQGITQLLSIANQKGWTKNAKWQSTWKSTVEPAVHAAMSNPSDDATMSKAFQELSALNNSMFVKGATPGTLYGYMPTHPAGGASTGGGSSSSTSSSGGGGGNARADSVVHSAEGELGLPYVWGGASPRVGFDCSGLTMWAYKEGANIGLPHLAADQQKMGKPVNPKDVTPGDLLFLGDPAYHVMMSIGGGKVIEAPHTGEDVKIISYPASAATGGIRRILGNVTPGGAAIVPGGSGQTGDAGDVQDSAATLAMTGGLGDLFQESSGGALLSALGIVGGGGMVGGSSGGSSSSSSSGGGGGGGGAPSAPSNPTGNAALGKKLAAALGWSGQNWNDLYALWTRESGWSNTAKNASSGAYGIAQALPPTKYPPAAQAPPTGTSDPRAQIQWGMGYIKERYGTPAAAWRHETTEGWYDRGAWNIVRDELAQLHEGEMVIPAKTAAHVRQLVESNGMGPTGGGAAKVVPVQLTFVMHQGGEQEARKHAKRFAELVAEDYAIQLVASD